MGNGHITEEEYNPNVNYRSRTTSLHLIIPNGVTIGSWAFKDCTGLTSLTIPEGVTIGEKAFLRCTGLINLTIPEGATIGKAAFYRCTGLTSLTIPDGVTIGEYAFRSCTGLTSLTIPEGITIGICAFSGCTGLTSLTIPDSVTIGQGTFTECTGLTSLTMLEGVTIEAWAFYGCTGLTSLTIPDGVTIGQGAFADCNGLTSLTIPKGVTIGKCAFVRCTSLTSLTIREGVTIGIGAFLHCTSLTSLILHEGITIREEAFAECTGLTSLTIPDGVTIGQGAFADCNGLTSLTIPKGVTIGKCAFVRCTSLTSLILHEGITIREEAFAECTGLTSVTIASDVHIDKNTFENCRHLKEIIVADKHQLERIRSILPDDQKHLVQIKSDNPYSKFKARLYIGEFNAKDCNVTHSDTPTKQLAMHPMQTYSQLLKLAANNGNCMPIKPGIINWLQHDKTGGKTICSAIAAVSSDETQIHVLTKAVQMQLDQQLDDFEGQQICHPHHELAKPTSPQDLALPDLSDDCIYLSYLPTNLDLDTVQLWRQFFKLATWTQQEAKLTELKAHFEKLIRKPGTDAYPYPTWNKSGLHAIVTSLSQLHCLVTAHPAPKTILSKQQDALEQLSLCHTGVLAGLNALCVVLDSGVLPRIKQLANQVAQAYLTKCSDNTYAGNETHLPLQRIYQLMGLPVVIDDQIEDTYFTTISDQHLKNIAELAMAYCNAEQLAIGTDPVCIKADTTYQLHKGELDYQIEMLKQQGLLATLREEHPLPPGKEDNGEDFHHVYALIRLLTNKTAEQAYNLYEGIAIDLDEAEIKPSQEDIDRLRNWVQQQRIATIEKQPGIAPKSDINKTIKNIQAFLTTPSETPYTNEQMDFWDNVLTAIDGMALVRQAIESISDPTLITPKALLFSSGTSTNLYQRFASNPVYTDFLLGTPEQPSPLSAVLTQLTAQIDAGDEDYKKEAQIHLEQCMFQPGGLYFALRYMLEQDGRFEATANMIKAYLQRKNSQLHHDSLAGVLADILKHGTATENSIAESFIKQRFIEHKGLKQYKLITSYINDINDAQAGTLDCNLTELLDWYKASHYSTSVLSNGLWAVIKDDSDWAAFEGSVAGLEDKPFRMIVIRAVRSLHPDLHDFLQPSPTAAISAAGLHKRNRQNDTPEIIGADEYKEGEEAHERAAPEL